MFLNARAAAGSVRAATGSGGWSGMEKFADFYGSAILGDPRVFSHRMKSFHFCLGRGQSFPGLEGPGDHHLEFSLNIVHPGLGGNWISKS